MSTLVGDYPAPIAVLAPRADTRLRDIEIAAAAGAPVWKKVLGDSMGFVLVVWSVPVAILIVGTPIVMAASLVIALVRSIL